MLERAASIEAALSRVMFADGKAAANLSDVVVTDTGLVAVVSDEGTELSMVDPEHASARSFDVSTWLGREPGTVQEVDLEGITAYGDRLVVCGSASLKRKKPKAGADNASRLAEVEPASGRGSDASDQVLVLRMSGTDLSTLTLSPIEHWNLREKLLALPMLSPFRELPSKDNGLDVEAVAADSEFLYFGLRGPVLRGHALVVRTDFHGNQPQLSFLHLGGLGLRGLLREPKGRGFYVLAGPTMELDGPAALYAWDGKTSVFADEPSDTLRYLLSVPSGPSSHPEAVFLSHDALCVASDGPTFGEPSCFAGAASFDGAGR